MNEILRTLSRDPVMAGLIKKHGEITLKDNSMQSAGFYFVDLASSIASQQLSVKAASTIWGRVEKLLCGEITPQSVLAAADADFRAAGLSAPKIKYIKCLAEAVASGSLDLPALQTLGNEDAIARLTAVKGIGRWTAEMFLIFSLARPDIFSFGDGGLRNAMYKLYGANLSRAEQEAITLHWAPYRSTACLYLWASLDNTPKS